MKLIKFLMFVMLVTVLAVGQETVSQDTASLSSYTLVDVAKHATAADCWVVLNNTQVYNLTAFIPIHPGGNAIVPNCGKDGTQAFNRVGHSTKAVGMEPTYLIGSLGAPPPNVIAVSLTPSAISLGIGATQSFAGAASNSTQGVSFSVTGGVGTITAAGVFTATAAGTGMITATSVEDNTKIATATVIVSAIVPPPPPPPPPPNALPVVDSHNDHFARHPGEAILKGKSFCTTCHGAYTVGGTAIAHGDRAWPSPQRFTGPAACYVSPQNSTASPRPDPFGDRPYPAVVCTKDFSHLAVFNTGTKIVCSYCHGSGRDDATKVGKK
jgi:hypothetical protein